MKTRHRIAMACGRVDLARRAAHPMPVNRTSASILDAALRVIGRLGYSHATMEEIAQEAGVSRRTVYTYYASKELLLRALIRRVSQLRVLALRDGCAAAPSAAARVDLVIRVLALEPWHDVNAVPDAEAMVRGILAAAQEELATASAAYRDEIAAAFEPWALKIAVRGLTVAQLAGFVEASTRHLYKEAKSAEALGEMAAALRAVILATLGADGDRL